MTQPDIPPEDHIRTTIKGAASQPSAVRRRWLFAGVTAVVVATLSASGISQAVEGWREHRHGGMNEPFDAEEAGKHIERMLDHVLKDASADQKARITAIAKAALTDLQPLRQQHRTGKADAIKLLAARQIDRNALERLRVAQMLLAQQASIRITQAMADAAEVLTPEQRATLGTRLQERMQRRLGHMG